MRWYKRRGCRRFLIAVLALSASVGVYSWVRLAKEEEQERAHPLRLSDIEDKSVRIPSLPSIQMHLIPRTQPTPLSPVTNWKPTNGDRPTTSVGR